MNVHVTGEKELRSIDWSQVHNWRNVPYPENVVIMTPDEELAREVVDAKEKEINNLIENDVLIIVFEMRINQQFHLIGLLLRSSKMERKL